MSEEYLVRNCAPTLAGLKTGSLFSCPCDSREELIRSLRQFNERLQNKGLRILPLRFTQNRALIYLYRPQRLRSDISDSQAQMLLQERGYDAACCDRCVAQLMRRLRQQQEFPHEIGLFLGYPPEDVKGFIDHRAQDCKCVGFWKVYGDEQSAKKKFRMYEKCTKVYYTLWKKGRDIDRLTVAG